MERFNIFDGEFAYDADDPEGFRAGMIRFGPKIGARRLGGSLYELPPGESICPYHYEVGDEEFLIVLEGRPSVRHPGGEAELGPGDAVCFLEGPGGAHKVSNHSGEPARVLMFSTVRDPRDLRLSRLRQGRRLHDRRHATRSALPTLDRGRLL